MPAPLETVEIRETPAPFYVLGGFDQTPAAPWVLGGYRTQRAAESAVRWQAPGALAPGTPGAPRGRWRVCTWDSGRGMFRPLSGGAVDFPLRPFPRTPAAHASIMAAHGIDPKHMHTPGG